MRMQIALQGVWVGLCAVWLLALSATAQTGRVTGRVVDAGGLGLGYAVVQAEGRGAIADSAGAFSLELPAGLHRLRVQMIGYRTGELPLEVRAGAVHDVGHVALDSDPFSIEAVVVSGSRREIRRLDEVTPVSVLDRRTLELTQSQNVAEGLCFQPGLRTETNCQTCNYTQIRMNGLDGPYSLLLIDGRPLVGSLFGLYGLEQLPAQFIERVEVVRGGGSALYGAGAIAGTINLIPREPTRNSWRLRATQAWTGGTAPDQLLSAEASLVSREAGTGVLVWGGRRTRADYDHNGDGFSELSRLNQPWVGTSAAWKAGRWKSRLSLLALQERRDGGDQLDRPEFERLQSESRQTSWGAATAQTEYRIDDRLTASAYFGSQLTDRQHYTGTFGPEGYGRTDAHTLQGGLSLGGRSLKGRLRWTTGVDLGQEFVDDRIPDYSYEVRQTVVEGAGFGQAEFDLGLLTVLGGLRATRHSRMEGLPLAPRAGLLWKPARNLQVRGGYARGFRPPQAFSADLHLSFAGGGIARVEIDPDLVPEWADSFTGSLDWQWGSGLRFLGLTLTGFHTRLQRPFVLQDGSTDELGNVVLLRTNGPSQRVAGASFDVRAVPVRGLSVELSYTAQLSRYDQVIQWSEAVAGRREALRTPEHYGSAVVAWEATRRLTFSATGTLTGPMWLPHFGGAPENPDDRIYRSPVFWAQDLKAAYKWPLRGGEGPVLELSGGVFNLFDAYQGNFDSGPNRDSDFVYGPARPRTPWVGLALGNW